MKHNAMRPLSLILAIWMFIVAIPVTVFADFLSMTTQPMTDDTVYVLAEDNTKRTAFEKHYYCSDGTFVAVTYPEAVHYQNDQGEWMDVDLRLSENSVTNTYESQSGGFKTVFTQSGINTGSDISVMAGETVHSSIPTVSMETENHALSWSLVGAMPAAGQASAYAMNTANVGSNAVISASANADMQVNGEMKTSQPAFAVEKVAVTDPNAFALSSVSNQVIYENVFGQDQNVSVRYSVSLNKIEEDILITAPTDMTSFSMQVECGTLNPVLNADNSVEFLDNQGQMVYHVSTPYLADAAFAISYDVDVTLSVQNGTCTITYTPDAEWMNDPERQYPIMLDPAVTTKDYSAAITDTYVEQGVNTPMGTQQWLYIQNTTDVKRAAVFKINTLPTVDPSLPIISARFSFSAMSAPFQDVYMKLELLKEDFSFGADTYSTLLQKEKEYLNVSCMVSGSTGISFDVSDAIFQLYSEAPYDTFVLSYYDNNDTTFCYPICSSSNTSSNARPYLTVTYGYTLPDILTVDNEIMISNSETDGFLYHNGLTANNGDLLILSQSASSVLYQTFKLQLKANSQAYRIKYSPYETAPNYYVSADRSINEVVLYNSSSVPSTIQQDWLIVPYDKNTFRIVLASDMRYVMTAAIADGSELSLDTVTVTICNGTPTNAQLWHIYIGEEQVENEIVNSAPFETGQYYLNSRNTGSFLGVSNNAITSVTGKINDIGQNISWKFTKLPDGYYTIQNAADPTKFLTGMGGVTISFTTTSGAYSESQKWKIIFYETHSTISNVGTGQFLHVTGDLRGQWRIVKCSEYVELGDFGFDDLTLVLGDSEQLFMTTLAPSPESPFGAIKYASLTQDFVYDSVDENIATVNPTTGIVTATGTGTTRIIVTHKVTGAQRDAYVTVNSHIPIITCLENNSCDLRQLVANRMVLDSIVSWHVIDPNIASVDNFGIATGRESGYTIAFAANSNNEVVFVCELEITDYHSSIAITFTSNEIEYLFCPSTHLNLWTSGLENAFELKVEIIHVLREYYDRPESQQPNADEIKNILLNELHFEEVDRDAALALFNECYLGSLGLYNNEFLTAQRIAYFNYLKEMLLFCAFGMIADLDPVNTSSNCWGSDDLVYDLSTNWGHNENSKNVMLGPYKHESVSYYIEAEKNGWRYFYSPKYEEFALKYGDDFVRSVNVRYLQRCISDSCKFYFCADPRTALMTSSQHMEYSYLYNYYLDLWGVVYFLKDPATGYYYFSQFP